MAVANVNLSNNLNVGSQVSEQVGPLFSARLRYSQSKVRRSYIYSITCTIETFGGHFNTTCFLRFRI